MNNYDWIKPQKMAWIQGSLGFSTEVKILEINGDMVKIKTVFQEVEVEKNRLYKTQLECPSR